MTGGQAALLIYALGIAVCAIPITRDIRVIEEADPLDLCDRCRDLRRNWMTIAPLARARAPWLIAFMVLITAATWPIILPQQSWQVIRSRRLKHSCDRAKPEGDPS